VYFSTCCRKHPFVAHRELVYIFDPHRNQIVFHFRQLNVRKTSKLDFLFRLLFSNESLNFVEEHFVHELRNFFKKCRYINCLLQGLCHLRVAARCWGPKQGFTYDSDLQQGEKHTFAFY
jgi:hypothetical protein